MSRRAQLVVAIAVLLAGCGRVRFTASDAGANDAPVAALDAVGAVGPDAWSLDAFSPAETPDASTPDLDAFARDAFAPDARMPDARVPDAGPPDTGPCALASLHPDRDGDGFGDPRQHFDRCPGTPGFVIDGTDCDDTSAASRPGGTEICDCRDDDCNGSVDELPSCLAASHVVWARGYGGPSSDGPWQLASDDVGLHVVGQSWMGGFEILPGERTAGFELYEARFDARTGLGIWGRGAISPGDYPIGVGLFGDRLYTLLGSPIRLEVSGADRVGPVVRHASSGTGFYGGSYERLAVAGDTGVAFIHTGFEGSVNVGRGSVGSRGMSDTTLYRVAVDGSVAWQRTFGTARGENERGIVTSASGHRVAVAIYADSPIDMGGGSIPGTDPWVYAIYDGATGNHLASARDPNIEFSMVFGNDGTLFIGRVTNEIEIRNPDGTLRERRPVPSYPVRLAMTNDGDLVVSYTIDRATLIDGTMYVPADTQDGLIVRYVGTSESVRWAQQLDSPVNVLVAGPSGDLYGVGGLPVSEPATECGGISAPGGGDAGDADIVLFRLR